MAIDAKGKRDFTYLIIGEGKGFCDSFERERRWMASKGFREIDGERKLGFGTRKHINNVCQLYFITAVLLTMLAAS